MPSSEDICAARQDVQKRAIEELIQQGHPRHSAEVILKYMTYEQKCVLIGQKTGEPYSPY